MKNESPLAIVQTAALCLIAVLLLILTLSGGTAPAASADSLQELAALYDLRSQMEGERGELQKRLEGLESAWLGKGPNPQAAEIKTVGEKLDGLKKQLSNVNSLMSDQVAKKLSK